MHPVSLFWIFLRLGLTSFGGPIAHIGYFQQAFVEKRHWLTAEEYAELVALCQFLPGPASSQVGMAIGHKMAGQAGCFAAWLGFTLPSASVMILLAIGVVSFDANPYVQSIIQGLLLVAVVVVAQAVWGMYQKLCTTHLTQFIGLTTCLVVVFVPLPFVHLLTLLIAGFTTWKIITPLSSGPSQPNSFVLTSRPTKWLLGFAVLLLGLPLASFIVDSPLLTSIDIHYRAGALVFGGGHVVLPLLEQEVVGAGLNSATFMTGYGFAQALPGPLFTFSSYIGAAMHSDSSVLGAIATTLAVFLPGYLLLMASLPLIQTLQKQAAIKRVLIGVNASVVGILLAALIDPVVSKGVNDIADAVIAIVGLYLLHHLRRPILEVMVLIVATNMALNLLI